jgi:hypothetical protein
LLKIKYGNGADSFSAMAEFNDFRHSKFLLLWQAF